MCWTRATLLWYSYANVSILACTANTHTFLKCFYQKLYIHIKHNMLLQCKPIHYHIKSRIDTYLYIYTHTGIIHQLNNNICIEFLRKKIISYRTIFFIIVIPLIVKIKSTNFILI